jgi:redox-sensitive bicupin YhaK (pirin superfamily)
MRLRRAQERHRLRAGDQDLWLSFFPGNRSDPLGNGFGALAAMNEGVLEPEGNMLTYCRGGSEVITYVIDGVLSHQDRGRRAKLLRAGEFQCSSASYSDTSIFSNASGCDGLHVLQLSLFPKPVWPSAREPQHKILPSPVGEQRFCLVGSADGREGSLALGHDVLLYSCMLPAGKAFRYALAAGRLAWLQVLSGQVVSGSTTLHAGDGAGFSHDHGPSLRAVSDTEILLLDLKADAPRCSAEPEPRVHGACGVSEANYAA